jgi:hypothetical protein
MDIIFFASSQTPAGNAYQEALPSNPEKILVDNLENISYIRYIKEKRVDCLRTIHP